MNNETSSHLQMGDERNRNSLVEVLLWLCRRPLSSGWSIRTLLTSQCRYAVASSLQSLTKQCPISVVVFLFIAATLHSAHILHVLLIRLRAGGQFRPRTVSDGVDITVMQFRASDDKVCRSFNIICCSFSMCAWRLGYEQ